MGNMTPSFRLRAERSITSGMKIMGVQSPSGWPMKWWSDNGQADPDVARKKGGEREEAGQGKIRIDHVIHGRQERSCSFLAAALTRI